VSPLEVPPLSPSLLNRDVPTGPGPLNPELFQSIFLFQVGRRSLRDTPLGLGPEDPFPGGVDVSPGRLPHFTFLLFPFLSARFHQGLSAHLAFPEPFLPTGKLEATDPSCFRDDGKRARFNSVDRVQEGSF